MNIIAKGSPVIFVDPVGREHQALVTNCFGPEEQVDWDDEGQRGYCVNVVWVSDDESDIDSYGRQIKRQTSVQGLNKTAAHGMYWKPVAA